jgi:hypothetical protein
MQETDISLSVSKSTRKNNKVSIFLDIRCHNSSLGAELCLRKQVDLIRRKGYIGNGMHKNKKLKKQAIIIPFAT